MPVRNRAFPPGVRRPISLWKSDAQLKSHAGYRDAKAGDIDSAVAIVGDLALPFLAGAARECPTGACFVAPHAREATGDNAIPQVLAAACAILANGVLDTDIVQITRVFHTGADPMERLAARPDFEGVVEPGTHYVLVDDVTTMGGTLADLASYIQDRDGIIVGALVLVNAGRVEEFHPSNSILSKLQSRHDNQIEQIFGIQTHALTANEANYLVGFRTTDEIRNRLVKAREETHRRLRSKGIEK